MRGGEDPSGTVSIWSWSPLLFGRPLNLVLSMPFRIFAYSSNILKANFPYPVRNRIRKLCAKYGMHVRVFVLVFTKWKKKMGKKDLIKQEHSD
jgi:hypothetical protein